MKPPRTIGVGAAADEGPLASLISAARAGRLVALLRCQGLTGNEVQELLRPESAATLRSVLTETIFSGLEGHAPSTEHHRFRSPRAVGKVLAFKPRAKLTP